MTITEAFLDAIKAIYGPVAFTLCADGKPHHFHVPGDKRSEKNGWYSLHLDEDPAWGSFGTWRGGFTKHPWTSRKPINEQERELIAQRIEQEQHRREAERQAFQEAAAYRSQRLWEGARSARPDHPYLVTKQVCPHCLRQSDSELFVPIYYNGQLVNLQRITPDGRKFFLPKGMIEGCYSPLGIIATGEALYVCEGWATGATLHEETGAAVACALTASNLLEVGERLHRRYPDAVLIIAGDDDRQTKGNPGRSAAAQAANKLDCGLMLPPWTDDEPMELTDFNDLRTWRAKK